MTGDPGPPQSRPAPPRPGSPRVAVVLVGVCWTLAVVAVVLHVAARVPLDGEALFFAVDVMVAVVYGGVAGLLLARRPHVVGGLVALTGVGGAVAALGGGWWAYAASRPHVPELAWLTGALGWAWVPGTLGLFLVVPWLVRDHPLGRTGWSGLVLGGALTLALTSVRLLAPMADTTTLMVLVVAVGLLTAAATWVRHVRGPVAERPGLGLLALGTAVMAASFVPLVLTDAGPGLMLAVPLTHLACQAVFPAALLVTVLRNRLWGIDIAVSRATIAALLTVGLALGYVALVAVATALADSTPAAQAVAALGVVLAAQPARTWLARRVHTLVYGAGARPAEAALDVGRRLAEVQGTDAQLTGLCASLGETLRLESVTLASHDRTLVGAWGTPTSVAVRADVHLGGVVVGEVALTPRPGERLDARTRDALDQVLPVVGAGLALAQGARDLERARDAATRARLAERRLIRRELHDGIGPWLSGLRLGLQGARNLLEQDVPATDALLAALQAEVEQRVEDVRLLSRSLLPPVLDDAGLGAALVELADRTPGIAVHVETDPHEHLAQLDAPVAAAAYAIAAEAVLNAARHSGASACTLRVVLTGTGVEVVCDDDGTGHAPGSVPGVGTRSMRERAEELGGSVETTALAPHGTRVHARLPLAARVGSLPAPTPDGAR
ncbi:sensor histidine kinase [Cellulomonas sp. P22]|uniref:sensor histidine kinase n=1 Tax=Cellulomonas sp. P22 TaxID=3373189 RepID=UPI0037969829